MAESSAIRVEQMRKELREPVEDPAEEENNRMVGGRWAALWMLLILFVFLASGVVVLLMFGPLSKPAGAVTPEPRPGPQMCVSDVAGVCLWSDRALCRVSAAATRDFVQAQFGAADAATCSTLLGAYTSDPIVAGAPVALEFTDPASIPSQADQARCFAAVLETGTSFDPRYGTMSLIQDDSSTHYGVYSAKFAVEGSSFEAFCDPQVETCLHKNISYSFSAARAADLTQPSSVVCRGVI